VRLCRPPQIRILETRARQQVGLGDLAGAEMLLRKAIDLKPNDPYLQVHVVCVLGVVALLPAPVAAMLARATRQCRRSVAD